MRELETPSPKTAEILMILAVCYKVNALFLRQISPAQTPLSGAIAPTGAPTKNARVHSTAGVVSWSGQPGWAAGQSGLALGVLRALAGLAQTDLLTLHLAGVAGDEACAAQCGAQ